MNGIAELKQALVVKHRTKNLGESTEEVDQQIARIYATASVCIAYPTIIFNCTNVILIKFAAGIRIAGGSTDFVNKVLENMRGGMPNGGLEELRKSS